jgi:2',3'-cyclic-nucleotide 2'-phosphodiesterase (5'-nucleotidase family)
MEGFLMKKKNFIAGLLILLLLSFGLIFGSCEGSTGPMGPEGPQGVPGEPGSTGPQGPQGGVDGWVKGPGGQWYNYPNPPVVPFTNARFAEINLLSFNDFHGSVDKSASNSNPGADRFAAVANKILTDPAYENPVLVAAGDNYQGSALSNIFLGEPVSEMIHYLGVKYSAIGNHEFDWGADKIKKFAEDGGITFLAANIVDANGNYPDFCQPFGFMEIAGVRIGLIGLTTPETKAIVKAEFVAGFDFKAPGPWLTEMVSKLRDDFDCGLVIALTHMGGGANSNTEASATPDANSECGKLAAGNYGFDAIIGGHQHTLISGTVNDVPIVVGAYNGRGLARLNIKYVRDDPAGTVITPNAWGRNDVNGSLNYDGTNNTAATGNILTATTVNNYIKNVIGYYNNTIGPVFDEVVGTFGVAIADYDEMSQWGTDLVHEYIERYTNDKYIFITNNGGWRNISYPQTATDNVTMRILYTLMPFDNEIAIFNMKGSDILYLLGLTVGPNNTTTPPNLISKAVVAGAFEDGGTWKLASGEAIDANEWYKVSTPDFTLTGGDNFPFPGTTVQGHTAEKQGETAFLGAVRTGMVEQLKWRAANP